VRFKCAARQGTDRVDVGAEIAQAVPHQRSGREAAKGQGKFQKMSMSRREESAAVRMGSPWQATRVLSVTLDRVIPGDRLGRRSEPLAGSTVCWGSRVFEAY